MPCRIRLSRAKGWKMPHGAVKIDRSTPWGNPFIVGVHGTRAACVDLYRRLMSGLLCLTTHNAEQQQAAHEYVAKHKGDLRGKDLACWCSLDGHCHGDVLLEIANSP